MYTGVTGRRRLQSQKVATKTEAMKKNKTVLRMDQSYVVIPYQNPLVGIQVPGQMPPSQRPLLSRPDHPKQELTEDLDLLQSDLNVGVEHLELYVSGGVQSTTIMPMPKPEDLNPSASTSRGSLSERCRMCAEKKKNLQPIFGIEGKQQGLAHKMSKFLYISVQEDDRLPLGLCEPCVAKLQVSHDLALSCASAQARLSSMLTSQSMDNGSTLNSPIDSPCNNWSDHEEIVSTDCTASNYAETILPDMVQPYMQNATKMETPATSKRRKTNAAPLKCTQCLISFSTFEEISSHYQDEHFQHLCIICTSLFKSPEELNDHLEIHKNQSESSKSQNTKGVKKSDKSKSESAKKNSSSQYSRLKRPRRGKTKPNDVPIPVTFSETKEGKKVYECSICNKVFHIRCRFVTHIQRHTGQRKTECQICHKMFFNNDDLRNHMTTHNKSQKYTCEICSREFNCKRYLNVHFQKVHNKEWYFKCKLCENNFQSTSEIEQHIEMNHKNVFSNMEDRFYIKMSDHQCHICKKYSSNRYNLQDHIQMHKREGTIEQCDGLSKEKQFQCEKCAKMFSSKTSLGVHLQIHAGEKPLQCQYCPKRFLYKQSLDQHEMIHVGNRPYKCKTCPKSYVHISALKTHVKKVHLNLRPFVCEFCNKGFPRKGNLNVHLRIHTGVRPFSCRYCERDFTQKQEMQRHELTHTNDTLYKCNNKCGFGSNRRKTVAEHEAACGFICNTIEERQTTEGEIHHFLLLH
ncbi:hypothetical protein B566_EDAN010740 [Ephemera danica]|nr:hypothetical protein B566_EDAN010740 [Ephemera danica]